LELAWLSACFDGRPLADPSAWGGLVVNRVRAVPRVAAAMAAATLLLGGRRLWRASAAVLARPGARDGWPWWLAAHGLAFAAFVSLAGPVLDGGAAGPAAAWAAAGVAALGLLAAAAVPPRLWQALARHAGGTLLAGAAVGLLAYKAGRYTSECWAGLHGATFWGVHALLRCLDPAPVCDPERFLLGTSAFTVWIGAPCAGYEGIGLLWVFLGATFWFARGRLRFPHALLLLPLGTAALWAANVVRITALVALGTWGSPALAVGGFHSQAGWLAFNAVALGLLAGALRVPFFAPAGVPAAPAAPAAVPAAAVNPAAAYVMPLLASVAAAMLITALAPDPARWYPVRVLAAAAVLLAYRGAYPAWGWSGAWRGLAPGAVVFVLWLALAPQAPVAAPALGGWAGAAWLAFRLAGSVVTAPLVEELAFRGYLLRRLAAADFESLPAGTGTVFSFLASSLLFGLLHGGGWLAGALAGLAYALTLRRRGALADAVVAHATTNALLAAHALLTGDWSRWT
jgi:exosortase E/protease (VPEID-CTERM system)